MLENINVIELDNNELLSTEGGLIDPVNAGFLVLAFWGACYSAGYVAGQLLHAATHP